MEVSESAQTEVAMFLSDLLFKAVNSDPVTGAPPSGVTAAMAQLIANLDAQLLAAGLNSDQVPANIIPFIKPAQLKLLDAILRTLGVAIMYERDAIPDVPVFIDTAMYDMVVLMRAAADMKATSTPIANYNVPVVAEGLRRRSLVSLADGDVVLSTWEYRYDAPLTGGLNPRAYIDYPVDLGGTCSTCQAGCDLDNDPYAYGVGCTEPFSYVSTITMDTKDGDVGLKLAYGDETIAVELVLKYDLSRIDGAVPKCKRFNTEQNLWDDATILTMMEVMAPSADAPFGKVECRATQTGEYAVFAFVPPPPPPSPPPPSAPPPPPSPPPVPVLLPPNPSPPPPRKKGGGGVSIAAVAGGVVGGLLFVLLAGGAGYLYWKRRTRSPIQSMVEDSPENPLVGADGMQPRKGQPSGAVRTQAMLETEGGGF
jgi:hypothetical protein